MPKGPKPLYGIAEATDTEIGSLAHCSSFQRISSGGPEHLFSESRIVH
jgi:hypothetical protein